MNKTKIISLLIITTILFTGCGGPVYEASDNSKYTPVTSVNGVYFEIPSAFMGQSYAITSIDTSQEYNGVYIYKDSDKKYLLFDIEQIVIACDSTTYDFKNNPTAENLMSKETNDVWCTAIDGKININSDSSDGVYKTLIDTEAEFSITPVQYGRFKGTLATVSYNDKEWSLFVGARLYDGNSLSKKQEEIISHMTKSFKIDKNATVFSGAETSEVEENPNDDSLKTEAETQPIAENINETTDDESEIIIEINDENTEEINDDASQDTEHEANIYSKEEFESQYDVVSDEIFDENDEDYILMLAKDSYYELPLIIGDMGWCNCIDIYGDEVTESVMLDAIHKDDDATDIIYSNKSRKTYANDGTRFEVAEFSVSIDPKECYTNVRVTGEDGKRLNVRGVSYTTRTYDIDDTAVRKNNMYKTLYVYYEIPIGCDHYYLEFGSKNSKCIPAIYRIETDPI